MATMFDTRRKSEAFQIDVTELKCPAGFPSSRSFGSSFGNLQTASNTTEAGQTAVPQVYTVEQLMQKLQAAEVLRNEKLAEKQQRAANSSRQAQRRSADRRNRGEFTASELQQRIAQTQQAAAEKRQSMVDEVRERVGRRVSYVKAVAEREKNGDTNGSRDLLENIEQNQQAAQEAYERRLEEVRNRTAQHNERVKEVATFKQEDERLQNQQRLENMEEALLNAAVKREEMLEERAGRAGSAYYRAKEIGTCMREINKIEVRRLGREIDNNLRSAQYQKEDLERARLDRLQERARHGEEVRLRRSSMSTTASGTANEANATETFEDAASTPEPADVAFVTTTTTTTTTYSTV